MDYHITLTAESKDVLNKLIDEKLKVGYKIYGAMEEVEENKFTQEMIQARSIDEEMTIGSGIKLLGLLAVLVIYFTFFR